MPVEASPDIYQGNLVLAGNNVTTIENMQFDINGSIVVIENATLILRNAVLNITQTAGDQFNMTLKNALSGFPRLIVENSTITSGYRFQVNAQSSSLVNATRLLTAARIVFNMYSTSSAFVSDSMIGEMSDYWSLQQSSSLTASNSSFYQLASWDLTKVNLANCTIQLFQAIGTTESSATDCTANRASMTIWDTDFSATGLNPGLFGYWNFKLNNSVLAGDFAPNFTLVNTQVNNWVLETRGTSNGTVSGSQLYDLTTRETSVCYLDDTPTASLHPYGNSSVWLVNATAVLFTAYDQARIYYCWYLDVHAVDSIGQDVHSANVTVAYPNSTVCGSVLTDSGGKSRFTLVEKIKNATGTYPVGIYSVNATYLTYSNSTTVEMLGNQQATLTFTGVIIPEFPSLLLVLPPLTIAALLTTARHRKRRVERR